MEATIAILKSKKIKKWIQIAMLSLLEKKPYEKITISEIAKKADISRFGFYSYYKCKEDILLDILGFIYEIGMVNLSNIWNEDGWNLENFWNSVLSTFIEHRTFLCLLQKNNLLTLWIKTTMTAMENFSQQYKIASEELLFYFNLYHGVGLVYLISEFLSSDPLLPVSEMTKIIMQLRQDPYTDIYPELTYFTTSSS